MFGPNLQDLATHEPFVIETTPQGTPVWQIRLEENTAALNRLAAAIEALNIQQTKDGSIKVAVTDDWSGH